MKCMNVMQCNSQRQEKRNTKTKEQRTKNNGHRGKTIKHKDHDRKTQLV